MSLKIIDTNIRAVTSNANKLNVLIHTTAMMIAEHAKEHGDCTRALALVKAMPASMRRTMLVLWFATYTPIRVMEKNDKVGMLKEAAKNFTPFDLEAGDLTPFYELADQNPENQQLYDFAKLVEMVSRIGKQIEKKIEDGKVAPEDIDSAHAIAAQVSALTFARVKATANDEAPSDIEADVGGENLLRAVG